MSSSIFREGMPEGLLAPMFNDGYAIATEFVDPEFSAGLLEELKEHGKYEDRSARMGREPSVYHDSDIVSRLAYMPLLAEYRNGLNEAITEVSGFRFEHLTYLTVRSCPVNEMSSHIHRNDDRAGPWLISLAIAGSGSINVYPDDVIDVGEEIPLTGGESDPEPLVSAEMTAGDVWGVYSREWSAPHAGGLNTSPDPKVLLMLYGWCVLEDYPTRST